MKKFLVIMCLLSSSAFSAIKCDLNVAISDREETNPELIISDTMTDKVRELANLKAIKNCESKGGTECEVKESYYYDSLIMVFDGHYASRASGFKKDTGKKLSIKEYAQKRKSVLCKKADACIAASINDPDVDAQFMEKIYLFKDKTNCNEIENFIF